MMIITLLFQILMFGQAPSQSQQGSPSLPKCDDFYKDIPFWTRAFYFLLIIVWVFSIFMNGIILQLFTTSVESTFDNLFLWTLFSNIFYIESLFMLFIVILSFNTFLGKIEQRVSSALLMVKMFALNLLIQLVVLGFQKLTGWEQYNGLSGLWIYMVTKYCHYNPSEMKMCCTNWKFSKRIYPMLLIAILSLLRWTIRVDMLLGFALSLATTKFSSLSCLDSLSNCLAAKLNLCSFGNCIQTAQLQNFDDRSVYGGLENSHGSGYIRLNGSFKEVSALDKSMNRSLAKNTANDPFSSMKGVKLGDS